MTEQLLTAKEAARYLKVHVNTVKRAVKKGTMPVYRISDRGDIRISQADLDAWLEAKRA